MMTMFLIERSEYDDDVSDRKIRVCWWCFWSKDQSMMMMFLCWWCFWSKDESMMMMFLIERSECDDDYDRQIRIWCWRCCCWSKGQGAEDVVVDQIAKVLNMLLIERSKCWICRCWLKDQNAEDVADQSSKRINDDEDWRLNMKTTWSWKASNDL